MKHFITLLVLLAFSMPQLSFSESDCKKNLQRAKQQFHYYTQKLAEAKRNLNQPPKIPDKGTTTVNQKTASRAREYAKKRFEIDELEETVKYYKNKVDFYQKKCGQ